jgi:hypothetical protein
MTVSTAVEANSARVCRRCGVSKPLADFYRNPKGRDGRESACRLHQQPKAPWRTHRGRHPVPGGSAIPRAGLSSSGRA